MQFKIKWINDDQILILRGKEVIAMPQIKYFRDRSRFLVNQGNNKTRGIFGMVNLISNGCFRAFTLFEKSERPCFDACYANNSVYAYKKRNQGYDICRNGVENDFFHFYLHSKENPNYKLKTLKLWRICSESSDMSLALAANIIEPWLKANPDNFFTGISSNYFFVPAKLLRKISSYNNIWIGHTVSTWFSDDDIENRLTQIERYQDYGIPTVVWITTNPTWIENKMQEKRHKHFINKVLSIVTPEQIIEVPYHNNRYYSKPILNLNDKGACCDSVDHKCLNCKLLCGFPYLLKIRKTK